MDKTYLNRSFLFSNDKVATLNDRVVEATDLELVNSDIKKPSYASTEIFGDVPSTSNDEILSLNVYSSIDVPLAGRTLDGKQLIYIKKETIKEDTFDINLPTRTRIRTERTRDLLNSSSLFSANTLYVLLQGGLDVTFGSDQFTYNAPNSENWTSLLPNIERARECTVKLHLDSFLVAIDLIKSPENYDLEYIVFNGSISKTLEKESFVLAQKITNSRDKEVLIDDAPQSYFVKCNGSISLNSTSNAFAVILKSKQ